MLRHAKSAEEPPSIRLRSPVTGIEAEFEVHVDGQRVLPESYWGEPGAFITLPLGRQGGTNPQLPTGGSVYFDQGVRGRYHAAFRDDAGAERLLSIDDLLDREADWE